MFVEILISDRDRWGHGGHSRVSDYSVWLRSETGEAKLRRFSTGGNMEDGYHGSAAPGDALKYAQHVCKTIGQGKPQVRCV